jgi:hypothetical protein
MAEYERWLIAKGNFYAPSSATVVKLVEALRKEKWIVDPASPDIGKLRFEGNKRKEMAKASGGIAVKTVDNTFGKDKAARIAATTDAQPAPMTVEWLDDPTREEMRLVWPVDAESPLPIRYPLTHAPSGRITYMLELHRALEYVYPVSDDIGVISTVCKCGEDLAFEWDADEVVPAFRESTGIFAECDDCSNTFDPAKKTAVIKNPFDGSKEELQGGAAYRFALKIDCGECFVEEPKLAFAPELVALVEKECGRTFYEFARKS